MKKILLFTISAMLTLSSVYAQSWTLDKSHSKLTFTIVHLGISEQEGSFKNFSLKFSATKEDFSDATIELVADVTSINTDNESRDEHLKGVDYFDAVKYPALTFKSKSFTKVAGNTYKLSGDLTIKGITKAFDFDVTYFGTTTHPKTQKRISGFKVTGVINRIDFGVGKSSASLSDEVTITANVEISKD